MKDVEHTHKIIKDLIKSPETHYWIAEAMRSALTKDPVDAAGDFEVAAKLFRRRMDAMLGEEIIIEN